MIGDFDTLDFFVVGQDDVAVSERLGTGNSQDVFNACGHGAYPLQVLCGGVHVGGDDSEEGICIRDFCENVGARDVDQFDLRCDGLELLHLFGAESPWQRFSLSAPGADPLSGRLRR